MSTVLATVNNSVLDPFTNELQLVLKGSNGQYYFPVLDAAEITDGTFHKGESVVIVHNEKTGETKIETRGI